MDTNSKGISSNRIYWLIGWNLLGFLLIFLLDLFVSNLTHELDLRLQNEQNRVFIGELLTNDLTRLEAKTYQLVTTTGKHSQDWVYQELHKSIVNIKETLDVLENGGQIIHETLLNIESHDVMTRQLSYVPAEDSGYVLEAIDLRPKLFQISSKIEMMMQLIQLRDESRTSDQGPELAELIHAIKDHLQSFPPLFTRMSENANRLFFESQQNLERIKQDIRQQKKFYFMLQSALSLIIVLIVSYIGLHVLRQIKRSNQELQELSSDLGSMKMALDEHAIVSVTDVNGLITYANDKFCDISGYSRDELIGKSHALTSSGEHDAAFYTGLWRTISSGNVWHGEFKNKSRDGSFFWVEATIVPFFDQAGKPDQYIAIRTDITRRKQMEQNILEKNHFLKSLTDTMGEGVYAQDKHGECHFINPEGERLLGWTQQELAANGIHESIHYQLDEHGQRVGLDHCSIFNQVLKGEVYRSDDEQFITRDGRVFPVSLVAVPLIENDELAGSVTVFQDISSIKETERLLADAKEKAEHANALKSEFLSNMSHELRTPMNAIIGFGQLLEMSDKLGEDEQEFVDEIDKAGRHLLALINEILDLSKIEAGKMELVMEAVDVAEIFKDCQNLMEPMANKHQVSLQVELPDKLVVDADKIRLKQVVINLLSNALKYNRPGGEALLFAEAMDDGDKIAIHVKDNGRGIPADKLEELFKPFNRLDLEKSEIEGTGIGLAITLKLAELMNGKLDVVSQLGEGSQFSLILSRMDATPLQDAAGRDEVPDNSDAQQKQFTVLYVEDNPANMRLLQKVFDKQKNIELKTAPLPELGLELAITELPDLILLDINMPGMDGYQMLEKIRQHQSLAKTPVIAVTANAMPTDIERGLAAGFNDYFTKPLDLAPFIARVNSLLHAE